MLNEPLLKTYCLHNIQMGTNIDSRIRCKHSKKWRHNRKSIDKPCRCFDRLSIHKCRSSCPKRSRTDTNTGSRRAVCSNRDRLCCRTRVNPYMPLRMFSPPDIVPSGRHSRSPLRIDIGRQRIDRYRGIDLMLNTPQLRSDLYIIIEFHHFLVILNFILLQIS